MTGETPNAGRLATAAEGALIAGLFALHLTSFGATSPVFELEVFRQDTKYILESLANGEPYSYNPQSHVLYHWVVERLYGLWALADAPGPESAFRFLKVFTALTGAAFLLALRVLFRELGVGALSRGVLIALAGVAVTAWFNFTAFETHSLAAPFIVLHLVAVVRMIRAPERTLANRALFVGSLVACGLVRIDLWRFAAVSTLLPALPVFRRWWRSLGVDLLATAVIGVAGTVWLVHDYLDVPVSRIPETVGERQERRALRQKLQRAENLGVGNLITVVRAVTVYDFLMPVLEPADGPYTHTEFEDRGAVQKWARGFFLAPLSNFRLHPATVVSVGGVVLLLVLVGARTLVAAARGDPLALHLALQGGVGVLVYTWFNPFEPFLWGLEFLPLELAAIAAALPAGNRHRWTAALAALAVVVAVHNWSLFYRLFR